MEIVNAQNTAFQFISISEKELDRFLRERATGDDFTETVFRFMYEKNIDPPVVYRRANLSRQYFWDLMNKKQAVKKSVAFSIAIGLRLDFAQTVELLNSAGYSCNEKKTFDAILTYCIAHGFYNINYINGLLYERGQELLKTSA